MHWQYNPYVLPLVTAAVVSAALALFTWRRRSTSGAMPFVLLTLAVAVWSLGYALELGSADLSAKVFWARIQYLGVVMVPVAWLAVVLQYTGREKWLTRRNVALLTIEPLVTLLLVWTNDVHGLIWSNIRLDTSGLFSVMDFTRGAWYWINVGYSYLLLLLGTLVLIRALIRSPSLYRGQASALLIGALAPWVGNALYVSGLSPFPHLDLTPFAFTLSCLAVAWGLFYFQLLDIVPVARDAVIEGMSDGVMVLDAQNRIVDLNPAAGQIIGRPVSEAIGQSAAQILSGRPDLVERYRDVTEARTEIVLGEDDIQHIYDLRISPLYDQRDRLTGRLVVLRGITGRKRAEEALERRAIQLTTLNRIGHHVASTLDQQKLLQDAVDAVREDLGYLRVAVLLIDQEASDLWVAVATDNFWEVIPDEYRQPVGKGAIGIAAETGETVLVCDAAGDLRVYKVGEWFSPSSLSVPIRIGGQVIGVLEVEADVPNAFDDNDQAVLEIMADQVAVAIRNVQLYAEIEERRMYLEGVLGAAPDAIVTLDADQRVAEWNPGAERLFGYSREEALGQNIDDLVTRFDVIEEAVEFTQVVMNEMEVPPTETVRYRKDDSPVDVIVAGSPIVVGGEFIGAVAVYTDITQRKRAEEALRESEERFRELAELLPQIICETDERGNLTFVNRKAFQVFGYDQQDFDEGLNVLQVLVSKDRDRAKEGIGRVLRGEDSGSGEYMAQRKDGTTFPVVIYANALIRGEKPAGLRAILIDITERKRAEEETRRRAAQATLIYEVGQRVSSELELGALLSEIVTAVHDAFNYYGVMLMLLDEEAERLTLQSIAGGYADVFPEDLWLAIGEGMMGYAAATGETQVSGDVSQNPHYVRKAEEETKSELTVPIKSGQEVIGVLDLQSDELEAFDETDVMLMETLADQVAAAIENARLYQAVQRELTERKWAEEQLEHYAAELEQANEEVKQFAYIVSHDLRAPLVNLKGFATELRFALESIDSAMETALPHLDEKQRQDVIMALQEDVPEALGFINSSATQMDHFISALLKLSRLGRRELHLEPVDMEALVLAALESLAHQIEERQVEVIVGSLPEIVADRTSMEQIMGNLMGNAVKYLDPNRPGQIEIAAQRGPGETTFHLRDNGRGIAAEDMDKVFAPFRRVGRQDVPGEGMGLPYVQALVRRHDGLIWCESELGVGTTFTFTISDMLGKGENHV